ncbi:hypothetical protein [Lysobacter sp. CA199]|uniref:hypothetical protein n=1 Tax=Lysobacter sp. CA199 TaxID=3455608 RepID=UPI003F8D8E87
MKLLLLILAGGGWLQAHACDCFAPLSEGGMRDAKQIYVFRLAAVERLRTPGTNMETHTVRGKIAVSIGLRGEAPPTIVLYSTGWCCGTRMRVGNYYAAFIGERGPRSVGKHNLLYLGDDQRASEAATAHVQALLQQGTALPRGLLEASMERIDASPPPPPPPPGYRPPREASTK